MIVRFARWLLRLSVFGVACVMGLLRYLKNTILFFANNVVRGDLFVQLGNLKLGLLFSIFCLTLSPYLFEVVVCMYQIVNLAVVIGILREGVFRRQYYSLGEEKWLYFLFSLGLVPILGYIVGVNLFWFSILSPLPVLSMFISVCLYGKAKKGPERIEDLKESILVLGAVFSVVQLAGIVTSLNWLRWRLDITQLNTSPAGLVILFLGWCFYQLGFFNVALVLQVCLDVCVIECLYKWSISTKHQTFLTATPDAICTDVYEKVSSYAMKSSEFLMPGFTKRRYQFTDGKRSWEKKFDTEKELENYRNNYAVKSYYQKKLLGF